MREGANRREGLEIHPLEPGMALGPGVESGIGVDAHAEESLGAVVVEGNDVGMHLRDVEEEVAVAHPGQPLLLFPVRESRHVVGVRAPVVESRDIPARVRGQRGPGEPVGPVDCTVPSGPPHHQPILAEHLLREEGGVAEPQGAVELTASRACRLRPVQVEPDRGEQRPRDRAVVVHGLQIRGPAVQKERAAPVGELVAFGVAPEVVVVVEDKDARAGPADVRKKYAAESPLSPAPTTTRS